MGQPCPKDKINNRYFRRFIISLVPCLASWLVSIRISGLLRHDSSCLTGAWYRGTACVQLLCARGTEDSKSLDFEPATVSTSILIGIPWSAAAGYTHAQLTSLSLVVGDNTVPAPRPGTLQDGFPSGGANITDGIPAHQNSSA